jgi:hypothetical protein
MTVPLHLCSKNENFSLHQHIQNICEVHLFLTGWHQKLSSISKVARACTSVQGDCVLLSFSRFIFMVWGFNTISDLLTFYYLFKKFFAKKLTPVYIYDLYLGGVCFMYWSRQGYLRLFVIHAYGYPKYHLLLVLHILESIIPQHHQLFQRIKLLSLSLHKQSIKHVHVMITH